jgi:hypothetical protein
MYMCACGWGTHARQSLSQHRALPPSSALARSLRYPHQHIFQIFKEKFLRVGSLNSNEHCLQLIWTHTKIEFCECEKSVHNTWHECKASARLGIHSTLDLRQKTQTTWWTSISKAALRVWMINTHQWSLEIETCTCVGSTLRWQMRSNYKGNEPMSHQIAQLTPNQTQTYTYIETQTHFATTSV